MNKQVAQTTRLQQFKSPQKRRKVADVSPGGRNVRSTERPDHRREENPESSYVLWKKKTGYKHSRSYFISVEVGWGDTHFRQNHSNPCEENPESSFELGKKKRV